MYMYDDRLISKQNKNIYTRKNGRYFLKGLINYYFTIASDYLKNVMFHIHILHLRRLNLTCFQYSLIFLVF